MDSALDIGEQIDGKENNVYTYILYHYIYYICNIHCLCVCETERINDNALFSGKWISLEIILCKIIQIQKDKYCIFISFVGPRILFRYNTCIYMHKHTQGQSVAYVFSPSGNTAKLVHKVYFSNNCKLGWETNISELFILNLS